MIFNYHYLSYDQTNSFSKIVLDYLAKNEKLRPFYTHDVSVEGIKASITARKNIATSRQVLVDELRNQYANYELTSLQQKHLSELLLVNTFTITTAHQPNIFTGPLYFIYKIIHIIKICKILKEQLPENNYVPIFYMGCEDADLDELGHININGEKLVWETDQTGAVGRMKTAGIENIINRLNGEFGHLPFGKEMIELCMQAYTHHPNIQTATLSLINELFKQYGLLILIPDNGNLKRLFKEVIRKELIQQFSHKLVAQTITKLGEHYKVQAAGREINLFYLNDKGKRERIELKNHIYSIPNLNLTFTESEILKELDEHPERFSPNVILRGLFQETILPNIVFIGGGGELAYWLELKSVFEAEKIPYPVLVLRNSFLLIEPKERQLIKKLKLCIPDIFEPEMDLQNKLTQQATEKRLTLSEEVQQINQLYQQIQTLAGAVDTTLQSHVAALHTKTLYGIHCLEKKMLKAEKRKYNDQYRQLSTLKSKLFPNHSLQERVSNFMPLYAKYGKQLIDILYHHSLGLEAKFAVIELNN